MPSRRCGALALATLVIAALLTHELFEVTSHRQFSAATVQADGPVGWTSVAPGQVSSNGTLSEFDAAVEYSSQIFARVSKGLSLGRGRRDIVMIAAWRRPEFLLMSLSHIWAATYADDHEFIFIFDHGVDPIVRAVATAFPATHKRMHYTPAHEFMSGNSFNLLEGYRYAHVVARTLRSELVYLLEEDVWIARDYFSFHRAAHARQHMAIGGIPPADAEKIFQVVGWSIPLNEGEFGHNLSRAVYACSEDTAEAEQLRSMVVLRHHYTSVATSFDTSSLDVIARHATKRYYEAPSEYIAKEWGTEEGSLPAGFKPTQFTEQDGLLNRDTQVNGWWTLSPRCPRAFHAGFTGYNRLVQGMDRGGSDTKVQFFERFEELAQMSPAQMISRASQQCTNCRDVVPVPLSGYYAKRLVYCAEITDRGSKDAGNCRDNAWPPALGYLEIAVAKEFEDTLSTTPPTPREQCMQASEVTGEAKTSAMPPSVFPGKDIRGHDLPGVPTKKEQSAESCCLKCAQLAQAFAVRRSRSHGDGSSLSAILAWGRGEVEPQNDCGGWVWIAHSGACYLKQNQHGQLDIGSLSNNGGAVAGLLIA